MKNLKIIRRKELETIVGLSRSSIYAGIKAKKFPPPIKLGERSVGWLEHEIQEWLESRASEVRKEKCNEQHRESI